MIPWHLKWVIVMRMVVQHLVYMSDCNMIDHAASDVRNAACHEDENPSSPLV